MPIVGTTPGNLSTKYMKLVIIIDARRGENPRQSDHKLYIFIRSCRMPFINQPRSVLVAQLGLKPGPHLKLLQIYGIIQSLNAHGSRADSSLNLQPTWFLMTIRN